MPHPPTSTLFPYTTLFRSFQPVERWDDPWLDRLGVRWVVGGPDEPAPVPGWRLAYQGARSEEHTSELQSLAYLVCRLLLEKKNEQTSTVAQAAVSAGMYGA